MTWLNFSKLRYGHLEEIGNKNKRNEVQYEEVARLLISTELPYTIKFRVEPQTDKALKHARQRLLQWFWRHFGPHYIASVIRENAEGKWLIIWRGKQWYEPYKGFERNKPIRTDAGKTRATR